MLLWGMVGAMMYTVVKMMSMYVNKPTDLLKSDSDIPRVCFFNVNHANHINQMSRRNQINEVNRNTTFTLWF